MPKNLRGSIPFHRTRNPASPIRSSKSKTQTFQLMQRLGPGEETNGFDQPGSVGTSEEVFLGA